MSSLEARLGGWGAIPTPLIEQVEVGGFRSARGVTLAPGAVCALVGEARTGKSNLLAAIRAVLDTSVKLSERDVPREGDGTLQVRARLGGGEVELCGTPPDVVRTIAPSAPPVLFLPASERSGAVLAAAEPQTRSAIRAVEIFRSALEEQTDPAEGTSAGVALSVLDAVQACCRLGVHGLVLLIEEPELFLRPQAQRYLYRLLRRFAADGNQVIYSTHSPAFLNVARLDELVFIERHAGEGTRALQPEPVSPDHDFRVLSEFDAERAELFLARAAVLVEGQTEKLALPFVFESLGSDVDRAGISIVECGGKWNIPLFARVCRACGVPFVAVFDRDAREGQRPSAANRAIAAEITSLAGAGYAIELSPDFEGVARMERHGNKKPERAWRAFSSLQRDQMPPPLVHAAEAALALAKGPSAGGASPDAGPLSCVSRAAAALGPPVGISRAGAVPAGESAGSPLSSPV
jgi:hypothetical protein